MQSLRSSCASPKHQRDRVLLLAIALIISSFASIFYFAFDVRPVYIPQTISNHDKVISGPTPQPTSNNVYEDVLLYFNTSDNYPPSKINFENQRYAVFMPTAVDQFPQAIDFFQSIRCLCVDHEKIDFYVVASNSDEVRDFGQLLENLEPCSATYGRWQVPETNINGKVPHVNIINLYDILPSWLKLQQHAMPNNTSQLLGHHGKSAYQSIKNMAVALEYEYDFGLWIDSESIAVRPFSLRETFSAYLEAPTIWRSRMGKAEFQHDVMRNAAKVLGRSIDSFGSALWTLESTQWIIEKAVIRDMVHYVETAHGRDFWAIWLENGGPFEIALYNLHIMARKLETVDTIFSKYMVLETEREMLRFGLAPAFPEMEFREQTGFLERSFLLLAKDDIQPQLSAFLKRYGQRLWRLDDLSVAPPAVISRLLLDTPLDLIVSGAPPLHSWWKDQIEKSSDA
ncbi:hypothetical protein CDD82_4226 [Ophiocordyceps australis]|uniref:Uncharacterized protein n=1 Tax=Ophiocordyceps australis TaxID=1399860 RepID=A0A2C5Z4E9_9HYPO|nr:hypothetical protein CDD82_4226 [Ophiocordyceps australis]